MERPTCPLPAMHIRSARAMLMCVTMSKAGQFALLGLCDDKNAKQNFALVPAADGTALCC